MFVYIITNSATGKYYIGQHKGNNLKQYLQKKFYEAKNRLSARSLLYASMRKHPKEAWEIFPLVSDIQSREVLNAWEQALIELFDSRNPDIGYNICRGGEGFTGPQSHSARKKISEAVKTWHADPTTAETRKTRNKRIGEARNRSANPQVTKVCPVCGSQLVLVFSKRHIVFCSTNCFHRSENRANMEQKRKNNQKVAMHSPKVRASLSAAQRVRRERERNLRLTESK